MLRALLLIALISACSQAPQANRDPLSGQPVLFTLPSGDEVVFDRVVLLTPSGVKGAPIPQRARYVQNEDRIDLSITPLIGPLFGSRVTPGDAKREGFKLGEVYASGPALVVDLSRGNADALSREVSIATLLEPAQPVRYDLGRPAWRDLPTPQVAREPIGEAYLLDGRFVIVSEASLPGLGDFYDLLS